MQNRGFLNIKGVKTALFFCLIVSCMAFSACTALQEAQQRRQTRMMERRKQADFKRNPFIEVTDVKFNTHVLESELPVVVVYEADWCGFCRQMAPILVEVAVENHKTFAVAKVDIDADRETSERVLRYKQSGGVPAYTVFQDGDIVGHFSGARPKSDFLQKIFNSIKTQGK